MIHIKDIGLTYFGLTEEEYQKIVPLARKENKKVIRYLTTLEIFLFGFLFVYSSLVADFRNYRPFYAIMCIIAFGSNLALSKYKIEGVHIRYFTHFTISMALLLTVILGTACSPDESATSVCGILIIVPLLFIERAHILISQIAVAAVVTIVLSYLYKEPHLFHVDLINCLSFFLISCYTLVKIQGIRLFNMLNAYNKAQEEKQRLEQELEQSQLQLLLSQIKPHFLFNVLNSLSELCLEDPQKANKGILTFAKFLRINVQHLEKHAPQLHPFTEELENIFPFVKLQQMRYGKKIRFDFDSEVDDFYVPTLSVEPLVENAVRHGIVPKQGPGVVSLRTYEDDTNIYIEVADDGVGFDLKQAQHPSSVGMRNVKERWQYLQQASFKVVSEPNRGTKITITIPKGVAVHR